MIVSTVTWVLVFKLPLRRLIDDSEAGRGRGPRHRSGNTMHLQELTDVTQHVMMLSQSQAASLPFYQTRPGRAFTTLTGPRGGAKPPKARSGLAARTCSSGSCLSVANLHRPRGQNLIYKGQSRRVIQSDLSALMNGSPMKRRCGCFHVGQSHLRRWGSRSSSVAVTAGHRRR
jgi:hypothetical protein